MRIISKFKDYYDYVGRAQYGEDSSIIYDRNPLTREQTTAVYKEVNQKYARIFSTYTRSKDHVGWLVFCDRLYRIIWDGTQPKLLTFDNYIALVRPRLSTLSSKIQARKEFVNPSPREAVTPLTKALGQPVYCIDSFAIGAPSGERYVGSINVQEEIPILKDIGFDKIMRPEQAYLTIYKYLSDTLRGNPDKAPPVEISNDAKIISHGFDKKSFRKEKAPRGAR